MGVTKLKDKAGKPEEKKPEVKPRADKLKEIRTIVRVADTDLEGERPLIFAIQGIRGIGYSISKAICKLANLKPRQKLGSLSHDDIENIESVIKDPLKFGIPLFLINRRRDIETGKDLHLTGSDLDISRKFDIQRYINLKTYRGWRHMLGQPVRGQRTRSSFREKGRVVGVMSKEIKLQMKKPAAEEEKAKK